MTPDAISPPVPLAIIGIGCLFPKADGLGAYWANLKNRVDAITEVPPSHWRPDDYFDADPKAPDRCYARRGGFLDPVPFQPAEFGIAPNDLEATDAAQLLGLVAAKQALLDAGYGPDRPFDRGRVGVILGVTGTLQLVIPLGARLGHPLWRRALAEAGVPAATAAEVVRKIGDGYVGWQENSFPGLLGNVVAGRIANRLNLGGTNCVVDAACASSLSAVNLAALELAAGRADLVVTGGVDAFNDVFMYLCFSKTPALSPTGDARPFAADGDGTILGEGLGMLVLKRLADAERDGDRVYAVLKGVGSSSDGKGNAVYAPSADGQQRALRNAYRLADVPPETVELVEAHGTGTKVGDATEAAALTAVYRAARPDGTWCALGSVKSQLGHTKAAAGAAGLIKAALALHHKVLPPTIKVDRPNEALAPGKTPFYVNTEKRPWLSRAGHPRRAGVSAFGFGGSNFHAVLEEHRPQKATPDWDGDVQILAFSAETVEQLDAQLAAWPEEISWPELRIKAALARGTFSTEHVCRLLLVVSRDQGELAGRLANARKHLGQLVEKTSWSTPDGVYFGRGGPVGKLGVLFPGQGSQYVGMLRDLACQFPEVLDVLAEADRAFAEESDPHPEGRLSDFIYPHPAFTPEERQRQEEALRDTRVAQPALGAVSLGALLVLDHFGVTPEAAAGHSYGELTALCAAGCYDAPALHALSKLRGRLLAEAGGAGGAMLAVHAPLATVERVIREEGIDLVVANKNAPNQSVLSGLTREVERAARAFADRQLRNVRLAVSAAFHSGLVEAARGPFRTALTAIKFHATRLPVFANVSAWVYPDDPHNARDLLADQLARPVDFVQEIDNMVRSGVRTFLEVGPGTTLTRLVEAILGPREHAALAVDVSAGKRSGILDLAHALARLAALGHPARLDRWDGGVTERQLRAVGRKAGLTVQLCGANYVKPRPPQPSGPAKAPTVAARVVAESPPAAIPLPPARPVSAEGLPKKSPTPSPLPAPVNPEARAPALDRPSPAALPQALQATQAGLAAFQQLQEQTAQLHRQFLEGQESAQRTLQLMLEQQQQLILASLGVAAPAPAPRPVAVPALPALPAAAPPSPPAVVRPAVVLAPPPTPAPAPAATSNGEAVHTPAPPSAAIPVVKGQVETVLTQVVAEKTGYPAEMLGLDMALDADLGVDSIKRVEILAALQERLPEAPAVKPEHLGTLHTLGQLAAFLAGGNGPAPTPSQARSASDGMEKPSLALQASETAGRAEVESVLMQVVADKTGYPPEMLEPGMALDADLGVDSIKRVEILSALQERLPEAPAVKPEHLGTLHTLGQLAAFLAGGNGPTAAASPARSASAGLTPQPALALRAGGGDGPSLHRQVLRCVPLDVTTSRTAVRPAAGSEVWVTADGSSLADRLAERLRGQGYRPRLFRWGESFDAELPARLGGLVLLAPAEGANDGFLFDAFRRLQRAAPALRQGGRHGGAVFVTVSRLDGAFGLAGLDSRAEVLAGGLAGLAKTARHEWPEVACKALDLAADLDAAAADALAEELFLAGPVEVGVSRRGRCSLDLQTAPLVPTRQAVLGPGDVVVLSGGARGVTAAAALALAEAYQPTLVLLGRSQEPTPEPDWLAGLSGEAEIKRALAARAGGAVAPRALGEQYQAVAAAREIRTTLDRLAAAGANAVYRSVDVRDPDAVAAVLAEVRAKLGPIAAVVHGAGVLADRRIEDKTPEQFEHVYATKVAGLRALLRATAGDDLKALVLFSSVTGRFGRAGQADYAVANEVLNKLAHQEARRRPGCRVVALNWGPWDGGMVTPSLAKVFADEGVGLIPPTAGGRHLVAELSAPADDAVEVVVLAGPAPAVPAAPPAPQLATAFERELDLERYPVLRAHVFDGRAVLPVVLHLEWLAHGALHGNPGLVFHGFNDLRVLNGVFLHEGERYGVRVLAGKAVKRDGFQAVPVELRGRRADGREIVHSRAEVVLAAGLPDAPMAAAVPELPPCDWTPDRLYGELFFHGPALHAIERVEGCAAAGVVAAVRTAPPPSEWLRQPLRGVWLADPLALDGSFQLMILWSVARRGAASLPCQVGRYRQYRRGFPAGAVQVVCRVTKDREHLALADIDFLDHEGGLVARLEGYECVIDGSLEAAFRRNRLTHGAAS